MSETLDKIFHIVDLREEMIRLGFDVRVRNEKWSRCKCPFHTDTKTPNFDISSNYYRCYACGEHGNIVDFFSKYYKISKKDAVDKICFDHSIGEGVDIDVNAIAERKKLMKEEAARVYDFKPAHEVFSFILNNTDDIYGRGMKYLNARGISCGLMKKMNVKYINNPSKLFNALMDEFGEDRLKKYRLINDKGNFTLFYHRTLFPYIHGNTICFMQGRTLERDFSLKYMNIGEVVPFPYNFDTLKQPHKHNRIFIEEGVLDTLAMMEMKPDEITVGVPGIYHMRPKWVSILKDYDLIIAFDNDQAGDKGCDRLVKIFDEYDNKMYRLKLPRGHRDVNDYHIKKGKGARVELCV